MSLAKYLNVYSVSILILWTKRFNTSGTNESVLRGGGHDSNQWVVGPKVLDRILQYTSRRDYYLSSVVLRTVVELK